MLLLSMKDVEQEPTSTAFLGLACGHLGFALAKAVQYNATAVRATALETGHRIHGRRRVRGCPHRRVPLSESRGGTADRLHHRRSDQDARCLAVDGPSGRPLDGLRTDHASIGHASRSSRSSTASSPRGRRRIVVVRDMVRYRRDANGMVEAIHGFVADITDIAAPRSRSSQHTEDVTRGIVDAMSDALMMTDLQGKILDVNSAFCMLTGYTRAEAIGQGLPYPWLQEAQMAAYVQWLDALRESRKVTDFDMQWERRDGAHHRHQRQHHDPAERCGRSGGHPEHRA